MNIINYFSTISIPMIITIVLYYGLKEKKNVFDLFIKGAQDGIKIVFNIFPTLIGIFLVIGTLRNSGIIDMFIKVISPISKTIKIPSEILPLAILRPISGSASIGIAIDTMKRYGVDSIIGKITSVIMGATETTFYTIAIYTASVKIKKTRYILIAAILADLAGIITSIIICQMV